MLAGVSSPECGIVEGFRASPLRPYDVRVIANGLKYLRATGLPSSGSTAFVSETIRFMPQSEGCQAMLGQNFR